MLRHGHFLQQMLILLACIISTKSYAEKSLKSQIPTCENFFCSEEQVEERSNELEFKQNQIISLRNTVGNPKKKIKHQKLELPKNYHFRSDFSQFLGELLSQYKIPTAVETGTLYGDTTALLAGKFTQVHTVEIIEENYQIAKNRLADSPHVHCYLGSSTAVLHEILPKLHEPIFFYLDAHWYQYWPLLDELEQISHTHRDNCIVVIDDIKVPGFPGIDYDRYGAAECSYEYTSHLLKKIFSEYTLHYYIQQGPNPRAKLIVIPKHWGDLNISSPS